MTKGIFITGTNTDVGKTVITRGLARILARKGIDVAAVKPVESGVEKIELSDTYAINVAAKGSHAVRTLSAYHFKTPVSPHLAARIDEARIDDEVLVSFLNDWLENAEVVLAEGAGGLLVPLNDQYTYADVIARTSYELLIVAPNILGAINTTLLTIEAAKSRGISIRGVILNGEDDTGLGNAEAISHHGNVSVFGVMPTVPLDDDAIARQLERAVDLSQIIP